MNRISDEFRRSQTHSRSCTQEPQTMAFWITDHWQTLWTWWITLCPCLSFLTTHMVISKLYVTLGALRETVMSFHGAYILLQESPGSAKRILWVLLHISLIPGFVSINCQINVMVSLNIILCQTEVWSKPSLYHTAVCMSASRVQVPDHPAPTLCVQWNRKGNKDSGSFRECHLSSFLCTVRSQSVLSSRNVLPGMAQALKCSCRLRYNLSNDNRKHETKWGRSNMHRVYLVLKFYSQNAVY